MTNPFDPSAQQPPPPSGSVGTFDVAVALREGFDGTLRNLVPMLGGLFTVGMIAMLAILLCFMPIVVVAPMLAFGNYRAMLDAVDGTVEYDTYLSGFKQVRDPIIPFLAYAVALSALISLPNTIIGILLWLLDLARDGSHVVPLSFWSWPLSILYNVVLVSRFMFAPLLIVDQRMPPVDAMIKSWQITEPVWGQVVFLTAACAAIPLIGVFACFIGVFPAVIMVGVAQASAYRQIMGRA